MRAKNIRSRRNSNRAPGFDALLAAFHAAHEKAYTFRLPDTKAELVTFHLTAEIDTPRVGLPEIAAEGTAADAIVGQRELYTGDDGVVLAPVYDRDRLPAGAIFEGPALVEEATTTTRGVGRATSQRRPFRSPFNRRARMRCAGEPQKRGPASSLAST